MRNYIIPFLIYILLSPIINLFIDNVQLSYTLRIILTAILLIFFWKTYKIKIKFDYLTILAGMLISLIWVFLDYGFQTKPFIPGDYLVAKLFGFIIIAPIIEELFVRGFLIRILISRDWENVLVGKFTWFSFIITVLFFGFSHYRVVAGLLSGIILNLIYYYRKSVGSCITVHFTSNLILAIYVILTQKYILW